MNTSWNRQSAQDFILSILFILSKVFFGGGQTGWESRATPDLAAGATNLNSAMIRPSTKFNPTLIRPHPT
jgi:hypothetical protein